MRFLAGYSTGTNLPLPLGVSSVWRGDGSVAERIVDVQGRRVFGHRFFPTGELYLFMRHDAETKDYALEYFDGSGRLVGTDTRTRTKQRCEWDGVVVDHETLMKKSTEMYKRFKE
jgi:YD repeat-containing protein